MNTPSDQSMPAGKMDSTAPACLFSFGVISDIQYADINNRPNYSHTCTRYYRNALVLLREAIDHWKGDLTETRPDFVMQLGDIIDGFNNEGGKRQSLHILQIILEEFDRLDCPVHHLIGNHEFYNFTRDEIMKSKLFSGRDFETTRDSKCQCFSDVISNGLKAEPKQAAYYHFSPFAGFRFIVLDTYAMSIIGHVESCPIHQESMHLVRSVNKNEELNSPVGLVGPERRFVAYNGGIGECQMTWLREVLQGACLAKEKVVIFGHIPFNPMNAYFSCLLWDYPEAMNLVRSFSCVVAVIAGHTHDNVHVVDDISGIHFLMLPGIIEILPGSNGFGNIQVYADKLVLNGIGEVNSLVMPFPEKNPHLGSLMEKRHSQDMQD